MLLRHTRCYRFVAKLRQYNHKTIVFAVQIPTIRTANRQSLPCKTIGIARQILSFYIFVYTDLLHTYSSQRFNQHTISRLRLHVHTTQKTDQQFYFSFCCYSQRVCDANIVHHGAVAYHIKTSPRIASCEPSNGIVDLQTRQKKNDIVRISTEEDCNVQKSHW